MVAKSKWSSSSSLKTLILGLPKLSKPYLQGLVKRRSLQFIIRSISRVLFVTASSTTLNLFDLPSNFIHLQQLAIRGNVDKRIMLLSEIPQEFKKLSFFALLMWSQLSRIFYQAKAVHGRRGYPSWPPGMGQRL